MKFEFSTAGRIVFGPGTWREAGPIAAKMGRRALLVTGKNLQRAEPLIASLEEAKVSVVTLPVPSEPTTSMVQEGTAKARDAGCDCVIGFGGGSALDVAKSVAALLTNGGDIYDYLEVVGLGKPLTRPSLPCLAMPTTAGTGSEVTRNAVLTSIEHQVKVSLRGSCLLPQVALIDPELTCALPPAVTAATGLDALTQLIEPFVSSRANPLTDALCKEGISRAARSLRNAFKDGANLAAREDMSIASLFGGLALANAGLGAVHGFASPIGGVIDAPHGGICAALLPYVMEINLRALRQRLPQSPALEKYREIAQLLTGQGNAGAEDGLEWIRGLIVDLEIPSLAAYGFRSEHVEPLVEKGARASSMKANPISLSGEELAEILQRALRGR